MGERPDTRSPPQGGLPPVEWLGGAVLQVACDESGWSGRNLLDLATPVFTHASVDLSVDEAAELMATLRSGTDCSPRELKSGQLLRGPGAGEKLDWLLASLRGRAHVHLVDKEYFLVTRLVDLFLAEPSYAAGTHLTQDQRPAAIALYRARHSTGRDWEAFLGAFVALLRTKRQDEQERRALQLFFQARDALAARGLGGPAAGVLDGLGETGVRTVLTRMTHDRSIPPPLEPILPALAETVLFWSAAQQRVLIVHDEQSALTADRLRRLQRVLEGASRASARWPSPADASPPAASPLAGLITVNSKDDARVQVADLLAGVARRSAEAGDDRTLGPILSRTSLRDTEPSS
ncbi:MAG TPA: hypothetical protein VEZ46_16820 [Mycobacteriales bacterium]|nr:hypothetical protein [Mycobacteriales bacterium]